MPRRLSPAYRARDPTQTVLYQVIDRHLGDFVTQVEAAGRTVPEFVLRELQGLRECGRLEYGFAKLHCGWCGFEQLIGLPCRGRGICPSCLGRRMVEGAARLVDDILPVAPVRQFVLTLPPALRWRLLFDHPLCSVVLGVFVGEVLRWQRRRAKKLFGLRSVNQAQGAAVTAIHRAGGSLNAQLHFHSGVLDGVYVGASSEPAFDLSATPRCAPKFRALPAPSPDALLELTERVVRRTRAVLGARGVAWETHPEDDREPAAFEEQLDEPLLVECAQASVLGVGLLGEQAGQLLVPRGSDPLSVPQDLLPAAKQRDCGGFNLHADRRVTADARNELEHLCRYLLHPPLAHDRLQWTDDGQVRLRFARPWRNGVGAMVLSPVNLIARLVPIIPRPWANQLRYLWVVASLFASPRSLD